MNRRRLIGAWTPLKPIGILLRVKLREWQNAYSKIQEDKNRLERLLEQIKAELSQYQNELYLLRKEQQKKDLEISRFKTKIAQLEKNAGDQSE